MHCRSFEEFSKSHSDEEVNEILENICDAAWNNAKDTDKVKFSSTYMHNAANHTYSGTVLSKGVEYGFILQNGDWAGTVMQEFGPVETIPEFEPPKPTIYTLVPKSRLLKAISPLMWGVYLKWREEHWFKEWERKYNYDRHFQPGVKIETYYGDQGAARGLEIATMEDFEHRRDEVFNYTEEELAILRQTWRRP